ncbi:flagellar basal body P-ring formation protein FlgA [Nitratireductor aquimarinus]|uniref:flagellar basal body P-ring formation chaperone FlgA n=1 Tax=Nitratireductor TaxID=245876 RepID=UPI0019D3FF87|nr:MULTISPECIES: flagellar basal body P-ring formation chaperone FlgA [Nitratireductor]MBN7761909.1 flagellar basal body P-ring formation protein FlgA [Nitratireductor aquibiodomus]MBN8244051.1 flagellar basal body P-ring formation protein FlgA [Nitratireductor aquimarinus]MBY6131585.1 flagellar basal body P-ring formation chaperone FlgA [Nitratireductor aquimarinus]MCA1301121.1 flagellar basal body P-ring formation chaperone FlgA [Nitratireductor aquimarinus]MCV0351929.1 flagellar basal body 
MKRHNPIPALFLALASLFATGLSAVAQEQAVVSTRVIYPGETISVDALNEVMLRRPPRGNTAVARMLEDIDGKVARRTLLPGRLIPISYVREAYLVETGSPVTVTFNEGALSISLRAVPLEHGAAGDMIRLRNIESGRTFTGVVLADGTVEVGAI